MNHRVPHTTLTPADPRQPESRQALTLPSDVSSTAESTREPLPTLISSILDDAHRLLTQYIELLRIDLRRELADVKAAALRGALAVGVSIAGLLLLLFAMSHALAYYTVLPLWAGYAVVGGVLIAAGVVLVILARERREDIEIPQALPEAVKDVKWIKDNT